MDLLLHQFTSPAEFSLKSCNAPESTLDFFFFLMVSGFYLLQKGLGYRPVSREGLSSVPLRDNELDAFSLLYVEPHDNLNMYQLS